MNAKDHAPMRHNLVGKAIVLFSANQLMHMELSCVIIGLPGGTKKAKSTDTEETHS